ncbi:Rhodanese-like domain-containing protein [Haematococcus lacustris]
MQLAQKAGVPVRCGPARVPPSLTSRPMRSHSIASACPEQSRAERAVAVRVMADTPSMEQRWESQVRDGRVRNISAADVAALQKEGWVVLDVRPPTEQVKAQVEGGVHVPLFVPDSATDAAAFIKKATDFAMGSWWLGGTHYVSNPNFIAEVQAKVPKDTRLIVACQKGLRSLAACEQLARAGYQQLAWINGGFDTASKGDIKTTTGTDIRYAGIGGLSEVIGWTQVQREDRKGALLGGLDGVIKAFMVLLLGDLLLFAYEQVQYWQATSTGPFGK